MSQSTGSENTLVRLGELLLENFNHDPTISQGAALKAIPRFLLSQKRNCLFVLTGYAGTGKTSIVNSIVKALPVLNSYAVLMAPTGRAAKVLSGYSGTAASTIHRKIYFQKRSATGGVFFVPAYNPHKNVLFIVDEASMIGWENYGVGSSGNLLLDLMEYVYSGVNCKLMLIGDGAQLPPVGSDKSPALSLDFLQSNFELTAANFILKDVVRQQLDSGILEFATKLRSLVFAGEKELPLTIPKGTDVRAISGYELQDELENSFNEHGVQGTVILSRSNKRCYAFNQQVRTRVFFREELLNAGDMIMAVKNNYYWLGEDSKAGFIANGDMLEVLRIGKVEERYGFNFMNITAKLTDYPEEPDVELNVWTDSLMVESASMPHTSTDKLYRGVVKDLEHLETKDERRKALQNDPFYNALQIKYAYAITAHKSQGGQWPSVIVDQGYVTDEMIDQEFFRWLYTSATRATKKLYLLNFSPSLIETE